MADLPEQVGRYPIVGLLATGGMAEILLGKVYGPSGFERPVVIKRVLSHLTRQQSFIDMFLDEARIMAGIRHPNVVHVHELGHDGDDLFLVMEYLDGESTGVLLRRLRKLRKRLPYGLAAHIVAEACAGLHAAHELTDRDGQPLGLVHRDLSPQNLFLTYSGQVKLIDFGVAHAAGRLAQTEAGEVKGKFSYMSPEQGLAQPLDRRSDLFSLGIVLFELSTGRRLFYRPNELLTLQAICQDPLPRPSSIRPDYPPQLEALVMKALARKPDNRFDTAADMRRALFQCITKLGLEENPTDSLATVMRQVFAERIEEKAEMIRRVQAGTEVEEVPAAEVDLDVDLPGVSDAGRSDESGLGSPGSLSSSVVDHGGGGATADGRRGAATSRKRRGRVVAVASASVAVALAAGGAWYARQHRAAPSPPAADSALAAKEATAGAPVSAASGPPRADISVSIDSSPEGATVRIDGEKQGTTPARFALPRGATPVELVLELRGYQRHVEEVVPDADLRLQLALKPVRRRPVRAPSTAKTTTKSFRRFD